MKSQTEIDDGLRLRIARMAGNLGMLDIAQAVMECPAAMLIVYAEGLRAEAGLELEAVADGLDILGLTVEAARTRADGRTARAGYDRLKAGLVVRQAHYGR